MLIVSLLLLFACSRQKTIPLRLESLDLLNPVVDMQLDPFFSTGERTLKLIRARMDNGGKILELLGVGHYKIHGKATLYLEFSEALDSEVVERAGGKVYYGAPNTIYFHLEPGVDEIRLADNLLWWTNMAIAIFMTI